MRFVVVDCHAGNPETQGTDHDTENKQAHVAQGEEDLHRRGEVLAFVDVKPKDTGKTESEPTDKESADQTEQVAEHGDGLGNDPGNDPEDDGQTDPDTNALPIPLVHQLGSTKHAHVNVLDGHVAQNHTGDDNGWDGNTVGDFPHHWTSGAQSGRGDVLSGVTVDDGRCDGVQDDFEAL